MIQTDNDIIKRVLEGNHRAYAELMNRHKDKAMTLAVRLLKNHHDAEEVLQDAFIRAFRALPKFEAKAKFSTWLYRIVYNQCMTELSRRGNAMKISLTDELENTKIDIPSDDAVPDIDVEGKEFVEIVKEELEKLPKEYSTILTLFLVNDLSYDEIVETTTLPLGTVKNRLFRARVMLKNAIVKKYGTEYSAVI